MIGYSYLCNLRARSTASPIDFNYYYSYSLVPRHCINNADQNARTNYYYQACNSVEHHMHLDYCDRNSKKALQLLQDNLLLGTYIDY